MLQFRHPTVSSKSPKTIYFFLVLRQNNVCFRCGCDDCIRDLGDDSLRYSLSRLNQYRALASPSLIALSSSDPLLTAFQISWEMRNLAFAEPVRYHENNIETCISRKTFLMVGEGVLVIFTMGKGVSSISSTRITTIIS